MERCSRDPATCPHANTSKLGSNKSVMRTFCKDCGNVVDEMPQAEAKRRQQAAQEIECDLRVIRSYQQYLPKCFGGCKHGFCAGHDSGGRVQSAG